MFSLIRTHILNRDLLIIYFFILRLFFFAPAVMASQYFEKYVFNKKEDNLLSIAPLTL